MSPSSSTSRNRAPLLGFLAGCILLFSFLWSLWWGQSAHASPDAHLSATHTDYAAAITTDLSITQTLPLPGPFLPGQQLLLFQIDIRNPGETAVEDIMITDIIPSEIISPSFTPFGESVELSTVEGENFIWEIERLEPGQESVIFIFGTIDPSLNSDTTVVNTATISAEQDENPANNESSTSFDIVVPTIQFNATERTIQENADPPQVSVIISGTNPLTDSPPPNPYADIRVDYFTVDGSAVSSPADARDFVAVSGTLTIPMRIPSISVQVPLDDDLFAEGSESFTLRLRNPYGAQLGARDTITITIDDDESPGLQISPTMLEAAEAGEAVEYTIALRSQPAAAVTVNVTPDDQLTILSGSELTFSPDNWNTPQVVRLLAIDDDVAETPEQNEGVVQHETSSADPNYDALPNAADVLVNIEDDDGAGVEISSVSLSLLEGDAPTIYDVWLTSQPQSPVTVTVTPDAQLQVSPNILRFEPAEWRVPLSVAVEAVDDDIEESTHIGTILHGVESADPVYQTISVAGITATISDNDRAGVLLSAQSIDVVEGAGEERTNTYSMALNSQPTAPVTVSIEADAALYVTPVQVIFTPSNWAIAQSIYISTDDDSKVQDEWIAEIRHRATSADPYYNTVLNTTLQVRVQDDDAAELLIDGEMPLSVVEGGQNDSYTIALRSQPTSTVTVALAVDPQVSVKPAVLAFTPDTWDIPQQVTVIATDDGILEGAHSTEIRHRVRSEDRFYDLIATDPVPVSITDGVVRFDSFLYLPLIQQ